MNEKSGKYRKNLTGEIAYSSFVPASLESTRISEIGREAADLLIESHVLLAELKYIAGRLDEQDLEKKTADALKREAFFSLKIEGNPSRPEDLKRLSSQDLSFSLREISNNIRASRFGLARLDKLPISSRLMKEIHAILMDGVTDDKLYPGEFRKSQNWIGSKGSTLKQAKYIPPNPHDMLDAISDLEKFINYEEATDPLIKVALCHYQLETIHPFLDGNARMARLMLQIFLIDQKVLPAPLLAVSKQITGRQLAYHYGMDLVRKDNDYRQWIEFYIEIIRESVIEAISFLKCDS